MLSYLPVDHFIGESPWTQQIRQRIMQVSGYRYSVLVTGPTGTGKELVARAVHTLSPRADQPFVPVNCAAVPSGLFASQLFGHLLGAFAGAAFNSLGCIRAADRGTIFLNEIGELELDLQAKLLRVIQERKVVPVGSHKGIPVDVRIVAATSRNLEIEVRAGRFRPDLFSRLNVLSIETAALSARPEYIAALAKHFLAKAAVENGEATKRLSATALALLEDYHWPGNIRQLRNALEGAVVLTRGQVIGPEAFPQIVEAVTAMQPQPGGCDRNSRPVRRRFDGPALLRYGSSRSAEIEDQPRFAATADPDHVSTEATYPSGMPLAQGECEHSRWALQGAFFNQSLTPRFLGIDRDLLALNFRRLELRMPAQGTRRVGPFAVGD